MFGHHVTCLHKQNNSSRKQNKTQNLRLVCYRSSCWQSVLVIKPLWAHIPSCCLRNCREAALWPVNAVKLCGQSSGTKLRSEKAEIQMPLLFSSFLLKNRHNSDFFKFALVSCLIRHRHIKLTATYSDDILSCLLIQMLANRIRLHSESRSQLKRSLTSDQLQLGGFIQRVHQIQTYDGNFKFTRRRKEATCQNILD